MLCLAVALFLLGCFLLGDFLGDFLFGDFLLDLLDRRLASAGPTHRTTLSSIHSFSVRPMAGRICHPPWMRRIFT
jgi:hypothetical protein